MDKFTRLILKLFIKTEDELTSLNIATIINNPNIDNIDKSLDILLELNCIKIKHDNFDYTSYVLTNKGRFYFKKKHKDNFYKYWYPIITALLAFGLSLIADLLMK